jgi:Amt family ammonium transporter
MAQHKNVVSTIMQAFVPLAIVSILWVILGFGLAFGPSPPNSAGIIGDPSKMGGLFYNVGALPNGGLSDSLADTIPTTVYCAFQLMFAIITPALIIGSIADRWVGAPGGGGRGDASACGCG